MALNIKNSEADRLARELADLTGESITDIVVQALEDRLARERMRKRSRSLRADVRRIQERIRGLPILDPRSAEDIIGFDEHGLPS